MAETFTLQMITHDEIVYDGKVESLYAPAALGYVGVLSHHAPYLTTLQEGKLMIRDAEKKEHAFTVKGGVFEMSENQAVLLAESIETQ
ncbi:hypothetical protein GF373_14220 [bacterium]|nr:hypothetical protein [bacterium]